jgi:hypothetical protein
MKGNMPRSCLPSQRDSRGKSLAPFRNLNDEVSSTRLQLEPLDYYADLHPAEYSYCTK